MNISWNLALIDNEDIKQYKQTLILEDIHQAAPSRRKNISNRSCFLYKKRNLPFSC